MAGDCHRGHVGVAGHVLGETGAAARRPEVGDAVSRVAEVEPQDLPAALGTVSAPPEQLEQFRKGEACHRRLAWVTLVRAPGQPAGRIRLQSGTYISPAYDLPDMPVRVAIPYPAPYPTGRGVIAVLGAETDAIVSLTPPWHVPARAGVNSREVSWTPASVCAGTATRLWPMIKHLAGKLAFVHRTLWQREQAYRWAVLLGLPAFGGLRRGGACLGRHTAPDDPSPVAGIRWQRTMGAVDQTRRPARPSPSRRRPRRLCRVSMRLAGLPASSPAGTGDIMRCRWTRPWISTCLERIGQFHPDQPTIPLSRIIDAGPPTGLFVAGQKHSSLLRRRAYMRSRRGSPGQARNQLNAWCVCYRTNHRLLSAVVLNARATPC